MSRSTLLAFNAGLWEGSFIRLDGRGHEIERFESHLEVSEAAPGDGSDPLQGEITAALTNRSSGQVRTMRFLEPPAEMQIDPLDGHWSLGPDRIGPWPWVSELALVHGDQRRRVVVRHGAEQLESLVVVVEGRPGQKLALPAAPLLLKPLVLEPLPEGEGIDAVRRWSPEPGLVISTMAERRFGSPQWVGLRWDPQPGVSLAISRHYAASGRLEPYNSPALI